LYNHAKHVIQAAKHLVSFPARTAKRAVKYNAKTAKPVNPAFRVKLAKVARHVMVCARQHAKNVKAFVKIAKQRAKPRVKIVRQPAKRAARQDVK
jgi:hypothetical protein